MPPCSVDSPSGTFLQILPVGRFCTDFGDSMFCIQIESDLFTVCSSYAFCYQETVFCWNLIQSPRLGSSICCCVHNGFQVYVASVIRLGCASKSEADLERDARYAPLVTAVTGGDFIKL